MTGYVNSHDPVPGWPVCGIEWHELPEDLPTLMALSLDESDLNRATAAAVKHREREQTLRELPRIGAALDAADAPPSLAAVEEAADPRDRPGFEAAPPGYEYQFEEPIPITTATGRKKKARIPVNPAPGAILLPPPPNPMAVARQFIKDHTTSGLLTLRSWRGGWWTWVGSHWVEREGRAVQAEAYAFTESAYYLDAAMARLIKGDDPLRSPILDWLKTLSDEVVEDVVMNLEPWQPTRFKIGNLLDAAAAVAHLDETVDQPSWLGVTGLPVVAVANGLLRLDGRILLPHTPTYWNQTAVPFDFDPDAPGPAQWLAFLHELWPDDPESIALLQEFFGYVISGRLDLHKIMLIVGPTRGGKGTLARILGKLIGAANVAGPTLSSLSGDFGMAPLIGKSLAVISDARLDAYKDSSIVVERLLAISGEDSVTVNRKYKDHWTGKLPVRFLIISNELPGLGDASGTIANRFVVLQLRESWLGREDHGLEDRLSAELTGILNWSLAGLDRLVANDRFTRPRATDEAILALQDLASPVAAFVREECVAGPTREVPIDDIYKAWKEYAVLSGNKPGNVQTFGRNLRAVVPGLRGFQRREGDAVIRLYRGISLGRGHRDEERVTPSDTTHEPDAVTRRHAVFPIVGRTENDPPPPDYDARDDDPEYANDDDPLPGLVPDPDPEDAFTPNGIDIDEEDA